MKTTPIGSEATGGMSSMLHEFLLAQSVPIHLLGRTKQKQMGQHENMKAMQLQNSAAFSHCDSPEKSQAFLLPFLCSESELHTSPDQSTTCRCLGVCFVL